MLAGSLGRDMVGKSRHRLSDGRGPDARGGGDRKFAAVLHSIVPTDGFPSPPLKYNPSRKSYRPRFALRGPPDMMSALEGSWKSGVVR